MGSFVLNAFYRYMVRPERGFDLFFHSNGLNFLSPPAVLEVVSSKKVYHYFLFDFAPLFSQTLRTALVNLFLLPHVQYSTLVSHIVEHVNA